MNILLLQAGSSEKYREAGYAFPKNLVEIAGQPVIQRVIDNLQPLRQPAGRFICVLRQDEMLKHHTHMVVDLLCPGTPVCQVTGDTKGAACSALLAIGHINNDAPLIITNGDQVLLADLPAAIADFQTRRLDGGVIVFDDVHPRWSYVRCNAEGLVIEAAEKRPISRLATAGFYYFAHGRDFVRATMRMILKDAHVDGAFYVCPAYNELLLENARIGVHPIPRSAYFSLATPQGAQAYAAHLQKSPR